MKIDRKREVADHLRGAAQVLEAAAALLRREANQVLADRYLPNYAHLGAFGHVASAKTAADAELGDREVADALFMDDLRKIPIPAAGQ